MQRCTYRSLLDLEDFFDAFVVVGLDFNERELDGMSGVNAVVAPLEGS